jgi:hypothetical protein
VDRGDRDARPGRQGRLVDLLRADAADAATLDEHVRRAAVLLGLDPRVLERPRDAVDDLLILLAAPLRASMLRLSAEGLLCALALGALVFRRALELGAKASLSGGWELQTSVGPALRLLGRLDEPLVAEGQAAPRIPAFADPALALAATLALRAKPAASALDALERAILPATPTADRSVLLTALGAVVDRGPEVT